MTAKHFEYIDENLNRIIENPNSVLYYKPGYVGKKVALFAMIREEPGVYRSLQITEEESILIFPWEPIRVFFKENEYPFLKTIYNF